MMEKIRLSDGQRILMDAMNAYTKPDVGPSTPDRTHTRKRRDVTHERQKAKAARQARKSQRRK